MTKFKVCSKIHLFIIISVIFIAIGMAVGTVCHFCANGFFNYGGEFASYTSVKVVCRSAESDKETIKLICDEELAKFNAYEVNVSDSKEIVYKFSPEADLDALNTAVDSINVKISEIGSGLNVASVAHGEVNGGANKAIVFAAIALSSAAAFQFIYFVIRYKLRAAYSALLACVHNLGVFVALAAITRIPVGTDLIAIGACVVFLTMMLCSVLFDRTRKNFANEKYEKCARLEVVDTSAQEVRLISVYVLAALAIAALILGVFCTVAQMYIGAFAPAISMILGLVACFYGVIFFTPAVHGAIDATSEKARAAVKQKRAAKLAARPKKDDKNKKSEKSGKTVSVKTEKSDSDTSATESI